MASIAVDSFGLVHIAYITRVEDPDGWDLKYAAETTSLVNRLLKSLPAIFLGC